MLPVTPHPKDKRSFLAALQRQFTSNYAFLSARTALRQKGLSVAQALERSGFAKQSQ